MLDAGARASVVAGDETSLAIKQQPPDARSDLPDRLVSLGCEDLQDEAAEVRVRLGCRLVRAEGVGQKSVGMFIPTFRPLDKTQRKTCEPASIVHVTIMSQTAGSACTELDRHPTTSGFAQTSTVI
ncbi:MAG: hypothetical protein M3256_23405 [Actinomycetota bacterium]|nr:hypothetical protein [Actinomycetota bacterium]